MSSTETLSDVLWRYFRYVKFAFMLVGLWTSLYFFNECSCRTIPRQNRQMEPNYKPETMLWMNPTIHSNDTGLESGDPVAFRLYRSGVDRQGIIFMGRVVGFSGQRIKVEKGEMFINGRKISEARYQSKKSRLEFNLEEMVIPRGYVYLLIDKRLGSRHRLSLKMCDSRHLGPIMERSIIGKITSDVALKSGGK